MTVHYRYMILGGGLVAGYAAQEFVDHGVRPGELAIISAESNPPYERPPLSKGFLAGDEDLDDVWINDPNFYVQNGIDIFLNHPAVDVDLAAKELQTENEIFSFEKLLIATGSSPRVLDVNNGDAQNIFYLRRLEDAQRIRHAADDAEQAVVIGGSFIGMEVSSKLREAGLETTLVFPEDRVWAHLFTPEISRYFEKYYAARGVNIVSGRTAAAFEAKDGLVTGVRLDDGQLLAADLVVAGVGVNPNTEIFNGQFLELQDGIVVNRFLETNMPDVFAAGDVARYEDTLFGGSRRVEHWDNAVAQGQHAARAMVGKREAFVHVPYFFSDVFDLSYEFWGDASEADVAIHRGDVDSGSFSVWWLKGGQVCAAFVMDRPEEERDAAETWIAAKVEVPAEMLKDEKQELELRTTA